MRITFALPFFAAYACSQSATDDSSPTRTDGGNDNSPTAESLVYYDGKYLNYEIFSHNQSLEFPDGVYTVANIDLRLPDGTTLNHYNTQLTHADGTVEELPVSLYSNDTLAGVEVAPKDDESVQLHFYVALDSADVGVRTEFGASYIITYTYNVASSRLTKRGVVTKSYDLTYNIEWDTSSGEIAPSGYANTTYTLPTSSAYTHEPSSSLQKNDTYTSTFATTDANDITSWGFSTATTIINGVTTEYTTYCPLTTITSNMAHSSEGYTSTPNTATVNPSTGTSASITTTTPNKSQVTAPTVSVNENMAAKAGARVLLVAPFMFLF